MDTTANRLIVWTAVFLLRFTECAVIPPPWADPSHNPCASEPGGWQLILWPGDGNCYRIFQKGAPCPDSMELSPGANHTAECHCPPGTAQSARDALCHKLFERGPCPPHQYFSPVVQKLTKPQRQRWGSCRDANECPLGSAFWPREGQCYPTMQRGPCRDGQLLYAADGQQGTPIGHCGCNTNTTHYWQDSGACYQHYTTGPCQEKGTLFLPGGKCGCNKNMLQYHTPNKMCYQLGMTGPCRSGHHFVLMPGQSNGSTPHHAQCSCKEGHVKWPADAACYRPYTKGPCPTGHMLQAKQSAAGEARVSCVVVPCPTGQLFFPGGGGGCHRIGTRGPCPAGQVVLFHQAVKTSVEGISYRGMCSCPTAVEPDSFYPTFRADTSVGSDRCVAGRSEEDSPIQRPIPIEEEHCGRGSILQEGGQCTPLYSQGPCREGEWVVPDRGKGHWRQGRGGWRRGKCECRPGYMAVEGAAGAVVCQAPSVSLARFLNNNNRLNTANTAHKAQ